MDKQIRLLKNNHKRDWDDIEWIDEFFKFLQGELPDKIKMQKPPKLSAQKAFSIIWYLQEHFPLLPDTTEKCSICNVLYNSDNEGCYSDATNKCYCHSCIPADIEERDERILKRRAKEAHARQQHLNKTGATTP